MTCRRADGVFEEEYFQWLDREIAGDPDPVSKWAAPRPMFLDEKRCDSCPNPAVSVC